MGKVMAVHCEWYGGEDMTCVLMEEGVEVEGREGMVL